MLNSKDLLILFKKKKINFFTGVPDSVLKNFLHVVSKEKKISHLVAVNEGSAVALAIGNYLNTKRVPLVYMQNSGLGNAINPIVSLADRKVYSVPMILLIVKSKIYLLQKVRETSKICIDVNVILNNTFINFLYIGPIGWYKENISFLNFLFMSPFFDLIIFFI